MVASLIEKVAKEFSLNNDAEITLEANPTASNTLRELAAAGINRLSVGVQSFENEHLKFLGRTHSGNEAKHALENATTHFERVSFDLIYAIAPHRTKGKWAEELTKALEYANGLGISHFSAYQLIIEKNTQFYRTPPPLLDEDIAADLFLETLQIANEHGFGGYEISNFARTEPSQCRHNLGYWHYDDYLGIGAGASGRVTLDGVKHGTVAVRDPQKWLNASNKTKVFTLTNKEIATEFAIMSLRLKQGLAKARFKDVCQMAFEDFCHHNALKHLSQQRLINNHDDYVTIPPEHWIKSEAIIRQLMPN